MKKILFPGTCLVFLMLCGLLDVPAWVVVAVVLLLSFSKREWPFWLGYFLHGTAGQAKVARWLYQIGLRRGGKPPIPMVDYCAILMKESQYREAIPLLEELLAEKRLNVTMEVVCRQYLALACEKTGDLSRAIRIMEGIHKEYACLRSDFYATLAYFYLEADDYEKACEANELARQGKEDNAAVYDNAALIAYRTGDKKAAEELFQKALEMEETMVSPKYYLGLLAEETGDRCTAAGYFRQVWESEITGLNIITREQAEQKRLEYQNWEAVHEV